MLLLVLSYFLESLLPENFQYALKARWKVSAKAIIYRTHFLGFINSQQYRRAIV